MVEFVGLYVNSDICATSNGVPEEFVTTPVISEVSSCPKAGIAIKAAIIKVS